MQVEEIAISAEKEEREEEEEEEIALIRVGMHGRRCACWRLDGDSLSSAGVLKQH